MSKADEVLKGMEKISREQMNDEISSSGGRSSDYAKIKRAAREALEPGGDCLKREELTEDVVSAIRTQVYHLNDDDLDESQQAKYDVTRRKMKEDGEDLTNDEGDQLYTVYIRQNPKKDEEPEEVLTREKEVEDLEEAKEQPAESAQQETQEPSQNGEEQGDNAPTTEAEEDFEKLFEE